MVKVNLSKFSAWYEENQTELIKEADAWKQENLPLQQEFLQEWPLERILTMNIDEYVTGKGAGNKSFCYELENGKYKRLFLSIGGGSAGKFGIYFNSQHQAYANSNNRVIPKEELDKQFLHLKKDLHEIITKGIALDFGDPIFNQKTTKNIFFGKSAIVIKLLCIYSQEPNFTGINNRQDQKSLWGKILPMERQGFVYKQNYEITKMIHEEYPELDGYTTSSMFWKYRNHVLNKLNIEGGSPIPSNGEYTEYLTKYSGLLKSAYNIVLRGAPGTGKSYLANQIAADIVSGGKTTDKGNLTAEERSRIGFVQFHPSYDYTDFVEGLRPITNDSGEISFKLQSGSFKSFVEKAKVPTTREGQDNFDEAWDEFFSVVAEAGTSGEGYNGLTTIRGFPVKNLLAYERGGMQGVYPANTTTYLNHDQIYNVYRGLPGTQKGGFDAYRQAVVNHLKKKFGLLDYQAPIIEEQHDSYVFIIDEINRGEISKIFGELFFSIDPGYRGNEDGVYTQYANLHEDPNEKFYIPDNVYIIGTMNDIDRSVDTFDFAMRRRFTFVEVTAADSADAMLGSDDTIELMTDLNEAIVELGGLTSDYQIGASYFLDYDGIDIEVNNIKPLWEQKLEPLLKDYFRGEHDAASKVEKLEKIFYRKAQDDEETVVER